MSKYLLSAAAACLCIAAPAAASVTYTFSGFSDVIRAPQSFTLTLADYLTVDTDISAAQYTSCSSGTACAGFEFRVNDPVNGFTNYSFLNFKDQSSGTFYYFLKANFLTDGVYQNPYVGFNHATLTVASNRAVPEPASWALMIAGFAALGGAIRLARRQGAFVVART